MFKIKHEDDGYAALLKPVLSHLCMQTTHLKGVAPSGPQGPVYRLHGGILQHYLFLRFYFLRQRTSEGERQGEKHQCVVASQAPSTEDLASNPGMCPD